MVEIEKELFEILNIPAIQEHTEAGQVYNTRPCSFSSSVFFFTVLRESPTYFHESGEVFSVFRIRLDFFTNENPAKLLNVVKKVLHANDYKKSEILRVDDEKYRIHLAFYYEKTTETEVHEYETN